jgi:hypothetical protein
MDKGSKQTCVMQFSIAAAAAALKQDDTDQ